MLSISALKNWNLLERVKNKRKGQVVREFILTACLQSAR
jgi:hypothetical protein